MKKFSFYISKRLNNFRNSGKSKTGYIIAVVGICISIITVLLTLSIADGFKKEIIRNVMGFESPLYLVNYNSDSYQTDKITLNENLIGIIESELPESSVSLSLQMPVMMRSQHDFEGLMLKAISNDAQKEFMESHLIEGSFPADSVNEGVAISQITANMLDLETDDQVDLIFFTDYGLKYRKSKVSAIFDTKFADYDKNIAFTNPSRLQKLLRYTENQGTRIDIFPARYDIENVDSYISRLDSRLNDNVNNDHNNGIIYIGSGIKDAASFFNWLKLLDTNVNIIIILMALIAVFTLISSLVTIVLDRIPMIGILKSLGTTERDIRAIFMIIGIKIVIIGLGIANIVALSIIILQNTIHFLKLNPDDYYISFVPMELSGLDFLVVNLGTIVLSFFVILIPLRITAKISPASVIKFL